MNPLLSALVQAGLMTPADAARLNRQINTTAAREYAEDEMLRAFQGGLASQRDRLVDAVRGTDGLLSIAQQNRLWQGENARLWASVRETVLDVASERAVLATASAGDVSMWNLVNEQVIEYADTYYLSDAADDVGSIPNLNQTSRTRFTRAFVDWQRGELETAGFADGLPQLIRSLESVFGAARAEAIGVTETARVFAQAEIAAARANKFVTSLMWESSVDERVCPICGPRHGTVVGKETDGFRTTTDSVIGYPPAHVRCRCRVVSLTDPALAALREQGFINDNPRNPPSRGARSAPVEVESPAFATVTVGGNNG